MRGIRVATKQPRTQTRPIPRSFPKRGDREWENSVQDELDRRG